MEDIESASTSAAGHLASTEMEGLKFYTKAVSLPGYDWELDFVVVTDFVEKELDVLLLPILADLARPRKGPGEPPAPPGRRRRHALGTRRPPAP